MAKVKMICPRCGSDDVTRDCVARRRLEEQKWEVSSDIDCMQCEACATGRLPTTSARPGSNCRPIMDRRHSP